MFLFSSLATFRTDADLSAVRRGCHAVQVSEIAHEVGVRSDPHLFQYLFDREKRRAQHLLSLLHAKVFEVLGRTSAGFLLEKMTEARRRQIDESSQCRRVPRDGGFSSDS